MPTHFILYTDGAAKGNPGPAGIGVALFRDNETEPLATIAESIADTTNNAAEYLALVRGLKEALLRGADTVEARTDSELMANQVTGRYRVGSANLVALHAEAVTLLRRFAKGRVVHVPRAQNALADKLANQGVAAGRAPKKQEPAKEAAKAAEKKRSAKATSEAARPQFAHTFAEVRDGQRHVWDVTKLWKAAEDLPVKMLPFADFASVLDETCWFGGKALTVRQVADHAKRIGEADLSRPVILSASGVLMDGTHRIARAYLEGIAEVRAVQFGADPEPDYKEPL